MEECWANCLRNCSNKITREHLVSQSLFVVNRVVVQGFPWCKDAPKEVSLASLTAKILCSKHNNDLSHIDTAIRQGVQPSQCSGTLPSSTTNGQR
jgi:hypothetical protein